MSKPSDLAFNFEAVLIGATKDKNGFVVKLAIHPNDVPDAFIKDFVGARYQFAAVGLSDSGHPVGKKKPDGAEVKHAALLCRNPLFQEFMRNKYLADGKSEKAARDALCEICNITSRAELSENERARRRFHELVKQYEDSLE